ncbi:ribonuclease P protein component [alpha proteobacterium AAP81b]|nr:ribonuclease P protein component [alpha proteobacterium AAP81b]
MPEAAGVAAGPPARIATIARRADFLAANNARRVVTPGFILLVRDRADGNAAMRAGYTVTRKIGNAVVRNRMKRRFRELARALLPEHGLAGADHILIGRDTGVERDFAMLHDELITALARARQPARPRENRRPPPAPP